MDAVNTNKCWYLTWHLKVTYGLKKITKISNECLDLHKTSISTCMNTKADVIMFRKVIVTLFVLYPGRGNKKKRQVIGLSMWPLFPLQMRIYTNKRATTWGWRGSCRCDCTSHTREHTAELNPSRQEWTKGENTYTTNNHSNIVRYILLQYHRWHSDIALFWLQLQTVLTSGCSDFCLFEAVWLLMMVHNPKHFNTLFTFYKTL